MLAGVGLRVWLWATGRPLWLDEEMISMNLRSRGLASLTGQLDDNQSAPLGWLWLQRLVVDLAGTGERALRLIPLLFGIGTLVVAWLVGRRHLGTVGTITLVGLCSVNEALLRYSGEVKHYSADAFFALLLLGLAAWVVDRPTIRRTVTWWAVAVVGSWLSMGAILVVPGFALVLFGVAVRRQGWWLAIRDTALPGVPWLGSLGVLYALSLRFSTGNEYLTGFWDNLGYPPRSGPLATVRWLLGRPEELAFDPLHLDAGLPGAAVPVVIWLFWLLVAAGIMVAARRRPGYGLLLAAPLVSALALALLRVVPLAVRLALWSVPALFVAVAVAVAAAVPARPPASAPARRPASARALSAVAAACCLTLLAAFVPFGISAVRYTASHPGVDDRAAVAWMLAEHRSGDVVLVVGSAMRAVQWYDPQRRLRPHRMVLPTGPDESCDPAALATITAGYARVIAYSGIRLEPYKHAPRVLAHRLAELGTIKQTRTFGGGESIVYVADLDLRGPARLPGGECIVPR